MLESLHVRGYRSLRDFRLRLGRVTVVTGRNGVGKSNFYRSLAMVQRMADGRFAEAIAAEGGMPKLLWAGNRRKGEERRLCWELKHSDFGFSIECGLVPTEPGSETRFRTDPDVKSESLRFAGRLMAGRKGPSIESRNQEGKMERSPLPFHAPESMLSEIRDGIRFPALAAAREILLDWGFYHQFRSDADSPMRRPQVGFWSPVLAHDGANLAATLQSIRESKRDRVLEDIIESAFPEVSWDTMDESGMFQLQISRPELKRSFQASELSDGTLKFFCLCAALCTERLPKFLVLNEPENSLHADLLPPLADLIAGVPESTQLLIVTHSPLLAEAVAEKCEARVVELVTYNDETRPADEASARRAWTFGD